MIKSICKAGMLTLTIFGMSAVTAHEASAEQGMDFVTLSNPLILSLGKSYVSSGVVQDYEIGLGGVRAGYGIGSFNGQGGIALKACYMFTWDVDVDQYLDDIDFVKDNVFAPDNNYFGAELTLSSGGYRIAAGAYQNPDYDKDVSDSEEYLFSLSLGYGF